MTLIAGRSLKDDRVGGRPTERYRLAGLEIEQGRAIGLQHAVADLDVIAMHVAEEFAEYEPARDARVAICGSGAELQP